MVENDYSVPPTPHCLERDAFLPISTGNFSCQDYQMKQPQKTLTYTKALQFWLEKAQLPPLGQLDQLAECVRELRDYLEPLTSFTDEEALTNDMLLHRVKVTSSRHSEPEEPEAMREQSPSRSRRAHPQGSFLVTCSVGWSKPATPTSSLSTISSQRAKTPLGSPIVQKKKTLAQFCRDSQVLVGRQSITHNC